MALMNLLKLLSGDGGVAKKRVANGFTGAAVSGPLPEAEDFHLAN